MNEQQGKSICILSCSFLSSSSLFGKEILNCLSCKLRYGCIKFLQLFKDKKLVKEVEQYSI